jgi:ABC-type transport system involved in cytochrome c biogenesis permease subunit
MSIPDRVIAALASPHVAAALVAFVIAYLALASTVPGPLAAMIGCSPGRLYGQWPLVAAGVALCAGTLAALARCPLKLANAGAWLGHMGVLVLACGAGWYATRAVSGDCLTISTGPTWSPIERFHESDGFACYLSTTRGTAQQVRIAADAAARLRDHPLKLGQAGEVASKDPCVLRAVDYRPSVTLHRVVNLKIDDAGQSRHVRVDADSPDADWYEADDYAVFYHADLPADALARLAAGQGPGAVPDVDKSLLIFASSPGLAPVCVAIRPGGASAARPAEVGQSITLSLRGRDVSVTVESFTRQPADASPADEPAGPALCVEAGTPGWAIRTWVPFWRYAALAPAQRLQFPGGGFATLEFSRPSRPLPDRLTVVRADYQRYPGSVVPKDFVCSVISAGRRGTISLNHPLYLGPYQVSQGSWLPSPDSPTHIILLVSSRPGLALVWVGFAMIAMGLPLGFYLKPLVVRRRRGADTDRDDGEGGRSGERPPTRLGSSVGSGGVTVIVLLCLAACANGGEVFDEPTVERLRWQDWRALSLLPVQYQGRRTILDTVAREYLRRITGEEQPDGVAPAAGLMELHCNTGAYLDRPVLYVREKAVRRALGAHLGEEARAALDLTGRISPASLLNEQDTSALAKSGRASADELARAGQVASLEGVLVALSERSEFHLSLARLSQRWAALMATDAGDPSTTANWYFLPAAGSARRLARLQALWREGKLADASSAARDWLAGETPAHARTGNVELVYNRLRRAPVALVLFAASLALVIPAAAGGHGRMRRAGLAVFAAGTAVLASDFAVRWALSGREWYLPPIVNQYEAVAGSALLAAVAALVLETIYRRDYFAVAAALYVSAASLAGLIFPQMGEGVSATHGILNSPVMAAHVSVIILGHALAGMTLFISVAYLARLAAAAVRPGSCAGDRSSSADLSGPVGAGSLAAIDRCNLVVVQLAAWAIVVGTMLGAVWGDFAWGRWWGWDPKETWALMTALVYLAVLHLRFATPRRHRGLVTALGCVLGAGVMVFNWTVVNYVLAGMHSYA